MADQPTQPTGPEPAPEEPTVSHDVITTADPAPPARPKVHVLTLLVGLLALAMSASAFTGWAPDLSGFDPRWLLAAAAAVVGALLLVSGLSRR